MVQSVYILNILTEQYVIVTGWARGVHGLERPQHVEMWTLSGGSRAEFTFHVLRSFQSMQHEQESGNWLTLRHEKVMDAG